MQSFNRKTIFKIIFLLNNLQRDRKYVLYALNLNFRSTSNAAIPVYLLAYDITTYKKYEP